MHRWLSIPLVLVLFTCAPTLANSAFDTFWLKFKTAVSKKDKNAVAAMTKLPYMLDSKQLNKSQFIALYNLLFPERIVRCFASAKPVADKGSYLVFCGEEIYVFAKSQGKWMFTEIGAND
jgi:hypothetical protein